VLSKRISLNLVRYPTVTGFAGGIGTAERASLSLHAVTDHPAAQCSQVGARAWIAHSKLSKVCESPPDMVISKALSCSFPQTSRLASSPLLVSCPFRRVPVIN
jgi:hypothetical protein